MDLNKEVLKTHDVIEEVRAISSSYEPLAVAMSSVYFTLEGLSDIFFLYQFSLKFFLEIVDKILISSPVPSNGQSILSLRNNMD